MIGQEEQDGSLVFEIFKIIGRFTKEIGRRVMAYIDNY